jgi:mRNA interferase RelE/StbE
MLISIMYTIEYSNAARRALKAIPRDVDGLIMERIEALAVNPFAPNNNVKKLARYPGCWLRVGSWRVVYALHEQVLVIVVVRIAPRGEVYR